MRDTLKDGVKRFPALHRSVRRARNLLRGSLVSPKTFPGVPGRIHPNDAMLPAASPEQAGNYARVGRQACNLLLDGLKQTGRAPQEAASVLDFGCGYGRVARFIAQAFGPSRVNVFDVDLDAARFCAREFGVRAIDFDGDWTRVDLGQHDLIWAGSVFTHLREDYARRMFQLLSRAMGNSGLLVFTAHGEEALRRLSAGDYGQRYQARQEQTRAAVRDTGFGFIPYTYDRQQLTGMAWASEAGIGRLLADASGGELQLARFIPQGWDNHQDVYMYRRRVENEDG